MIWNEKYEKMDRAALRQVQLERLQATLNRAVRNVAFYRHALAGTGADGVRELVRPRTAPLHDAGGSAPQLPLRYVRGAPARHRAHPVHLRHDGQPRRGRATRATTSAAGRNASRASSPPAGSPSTTWCRSPSPTACSAAVSGFTTERSASAPRSFPPPRARFRSSSLSCAISRQRPSPAPPGMPLPSPRR